MPWDGTELWVAPLRRQRRGAAGRRRAGGVGLPARVGSRRPPALRLRPRRLVEPLPRPRAGRRAERRGGGAGAADRGAGRLRPPAVAVRRRHLRLPRERRDRLRALPRARGTALPAASRRAGNRPTSACRSPPSATRCSSARGERVAFAAASPESETAVVVYDVERGETEVVRTLQRGAGRPGLRLAAAADRVPDRRAARSPTASTTRRRTPSFEAPEGELPPLIVESHGGPDLPRHPRPRPRVPLLDQPRDRRRRRQLPRLQRLRPRVPQQAARHLGRRRHRGLRQRGAATWPSRARPTASGWRSAAARPAATRPSARSPSTTRSPPAPATTASPTPRRWPRDTHKFESRYLDRLIGPYPEQAELYRERSPINHVERLRVPVILFQGLEDEVVPPNQAETMVAALAAQRRPPRLPGLRGRAARLPQGGDQHPLPRSRALLLRPDHGLRAGRRSGAGRDRRALDPA